MARERRSDPMPVKHWSSAGLLLTYWCNARCASCYLCSGPECGEEMSVAQALSYWRQLVEASRHGCRVHLSGGEPFGNWQRLIELCRRGQQDKLAPIQKIETNAFWAGDEKLIRRRLAALDAAGVVKISISADPYHQQFVPIERCRLLARVAEQMLGSQRVQVRWRDWLQDGFDTDALSEPKRQAVFRRYGAHRRDRFNGRAAELLSEHVKLRPVQEFDDKPCRQPLLRSKHVHIDGAGRVMPGTCAGIVLGRLGQQSVAELWRRLDAEHGDRAARPIVATLAAKGPVGLLDEARAAEYVPRSGYAAKCHLCWEIRRQFVLKGLYSSRLGAAWMYDRPAAESVKT